MRSAPCAIPSPRAAELIEQILAQPDEPHTLQSVVDLAVAEIDGCVWAGITRHRSASQAAQESAGP